MRSLQIVRYLSVAGAFALLLVFAATPAVAGQCEDDCMDQFDADVQACDDDLAQKQADNDADEQACFDNHANKPAGLDGCLNAVSKHRRNAIKQHEQCLKRADQDLDACLDACGGSPA